MTEPKTEIAKELEDAPFEPLDIAEEIAGRYGLEWDQDELMSAMAQFIKGKCNKDEFIAVMEAMAAADEAGDIEYLDDFDVLNMAERKPRATIEDEDFGIDDIDFGIDDIDDEGDEDDDA